MRAVEHLFEIGRTQILAVIGLIVSLFIWRAREFEKVVGRLRTAWNAYSAGAKLGHYERIAWLSLGQMTLWILAFVGCVYVTICMFEFFSLTGTLYEVADHADVSLLEILGRRANSIRNSIVISGVVIAVPLIAEWMIGLVAEAHSVTDGSEASPHLFGIPREWRDAPTEMWAQRLRAVSAEPGNISDEWRNGWEAWTRVVGAIRDA